jgi:diguanylate cyclase (GGDEF)-like protein
LSYNGELRKIRDKNKRNELGSLAASFDKMRQIVLDKIQIINKHNDQLEATVHQRTVELEKANLELEKLASYDPLTGLANRRLFYNNLASFISLAERHNSGMAIFSIDLQKFKDINDNWGHKAGDRYLKEFAARLNSVSRESDCIARIGGDEFVILLHDINEETWEDTLQKFIDATHAPFDWAGYKLHFAANYGVALYPTHGTDGNTLLHYADEAMYAAKNSGKEYALFSHRTEDIFRFKAKTRT